MSDRRLRGQLEAKFPWLLTDDEQVSGADVIQALCDWRTELLAEEAEPPEDERESPTDADIIEAAIEEHNRDGECEVDEEGCVSRGDDDGAYVMAWVWVSFEEAFCRTCHKKYDGAGDGHDGECPECADKTEDTRCHVCEALPDEPHQDPDCETIESCPKCGEQVARKDAFEDDGEGDEAGRTFCYCSENCREKH